MASTPVRPAFSATCAERPTGTPARPSAIVAAPVDGALATACYLFAYLVRFQGPELSTFVPRAVVTLPLVVGCQLLGLWMGGIYGADRRRLWLLAAVRGTTIGTSAAAALIAWWFGFAGLSRVAFLLDALLLSMATLGWRAAWTLARSRIEPDPLGVMIDRAKEADSFGRTLVAMFGYRELLKNLVLKDLKLKYRGSALGFVWSLVNPLLMIVVYTVAFTYILRQRVQGFVFYVMLGILAWTFFVNSATMATGAIVENAGLVKSVLFPRAILPVATVLFNLTQYLLTVLVFLPLMLLLYRVPLGPQMLLYPIFLALQVFFTIGVALMLATGTAYFRDIRHFLDVALAALFWLTPIVYQDAGLSPRARAAILLGPMSPYISAYQKIFFYREWPELSIWLLATIYAATAFVLGAAIMLANEGDFSEQI
jgi:lipopolysaccharide transport system permease protein